MDWVVSIATVGLAVLTAISGFGAYKQKQKLNQQRERNRDWVHQKVSYALELLNSKDEDDIVRACQILGMLGPSSRETDLILTKLSQLLTSPLWSNNSRINRYAASAVTKLHVLLRVA